MRDFPSFHEWWGISEEDFVALEMTEADLERSVAGSLLYQRYVLAREVDALWRSVFTTPQARFFARHILHPLVRLLRRLGVIEGGDDAE